MTCCCCPTIPIEVSSAVSLLAYGGQDGLLKWSRPESPMHAMPGGDMLWAPYLDPVRLYNAHGRLADTRDGPLLDAGEPAGDYGFTENGYYRVFPADSEADWSEYPHDETITGTVKALKWNGSAFVVVDFQMPCRGAGENYLSHFSHDLYIVDLIEPSFLPAPEILGDTTVYRDSDGARMIIPGSEEEPFAQRLPTNPEAEPTPMFGGLHLNFNVFRASGDVYAMSFVNKSGTSPNLIAAGTWAERSSPETLSAYSHIILRDYDDDTTEWEDLDANRITTAGAPAAVTSGGYVIHNGPCSVRIPIEMGINDPTFGNPVTYPIGTVFAIGELSHENIGGISRAVNTRDGHKYTYAGIATLSDGVWIRMLRWSLDEEEEYVQDPGMLVAFFKEDGEPVWDRFFEEMESFLPLPRLTQLGLGGDLFIRYEQGSFPNLTRYMMRLNRETGATVFNVRFVANQPFVGGSIAWYNEVTDQVGVSFGTASVNPFHLWLTESVEE